ncbi:hypothetical protein IW262DRAFT_1301181 [Armillaria fumosa]|nr:hypothetical protein IW262DRAFT_1301181 [Armillaria fumosa]
MTPIGVELLPDMGTKINLTMCPGPETVMVDLGDGIDYYGNCAHWQDTNDILAEGLAVIRNRSSTSRPVMVDDMAVLVPSTMPDNIDNLTFSSFGLIAHCQPVVDCVFHGIDDDSMDNKLALHCPSFNPPYNINTTITDCLSLSGSTIDMFNLTNNTLPIIPGAYPPYSVLNPYGALLTAYWSSYEVIFPALHDLGGTIIVKSNRHYMVSLQKGFEGAICTPEDCLQWWKAAKRIHIVFSWSLRALAYITQTWMLAMRTTLDGINGYAFASPPVMSNFNTTSALFIALNSPYEMNLVDYLKPTFRNFLTLSTETFNTDLSRNISFGAIGLASPIFERDISTSGNYIAMRSASRYPLAPLVAVLATLYTYAFLALAVTVSSVMLSSREVIVTKNGGKEHRITAIELVQLRLTNPLASIAERFSDPARPELLLESSAVDMFHEHPDAEKLGVVMVDDEGENGEGIIRRRRTFRVESVEQRLTRLSGSTLNIISDGDFGQKDH